MRRSHLTALAVSNSFPSNKGHSTKKKSEQPEVGSSQKLSTWGLASHRSLFVSADIFIHSPTGTIGKYYLTISEITNELVFFWDELNDFNRELG
jgi:hypothetical protein